MVRESRFALLIQYPTYAQEVEYNPQIWATVVGLVSIVVALVVVQTRGYMGIVALGVVTMLEDMDFVVLVVVLVVVVVVLVVPGVWA